MPAHPTLAEYLVVGNLFCFLFLSSMEYGKSRNQSLRDFQVFFINPIMLFIKLCFYFLFYLE